MGDTMKKKTFIMLIVLCMAQLLASCSKTPGLQSDNYNFQTEIIYQKEGYVPSYGYQIFQTMYYESGIDKLDVLGFKREEYSNVILDTDRELGEIDFRSQEKINEEVLEELKSFLTEMEAEELSRLTKEDDILVFEDVIYAYTYEKIEDENYHCYLVKYVPNVDVSYVSFTIPYSAIDNEKQTEKIAVYADGTICIEDTVWFDEQLKNIEKESDEYEVDAFTNEEIMVSLKNVGLEEIAESIFVIFNKRYFGELFYCEFVRTVYTQTPEGSVEEEKVYFLEMDLDGNVLAVIYMDGMKFNSPTVIIPKKLSENGKYYDVLH